MCRWRGYDRGLPIWEALNRVNVAVRSLNAKYQTFLKSNSTYNSKKKLDSVGELNESWPEIEDSQRFWPYAKDLYIRKMAGKRTYNFYRAVDLQFTSLK